MSIAEKVISWTERGLVPDFLVRAGIRSLCKKRLSEVNQGSDELNQKRLEELITKFSTGPIAPLPEKANEQHYEVPASFFELVLGKHKKYSCCYFSREDTTLNRAEELALETTCTRAELENGQTILELGCGWGSLTLWMCEHFPDSKVTAVSNSQSQRNYILDEAKKRGVGENLTVITCDMNDFDIQTRFDRVVSVEMFEHMRNYEQLLANVATWLKDEGKLFVHIFCHRQFTYEFQDKGKSDWMSRYFFSGGVMPSEDLLSRFSNNMKVVKQWNWSGTHYYRTSEAWLKNLDRNRDKVMLILESTYGMANASLWFHRWRMFFLAVAELFNFDEGTEWLVSHYLFEKQK